MGHRDKYKDVGGSRLRLSFDFQETVKKFFEMSTDYARIVFIAGNVESLIGEPSRIPSWTTAVAKEILEQKPAFATLHLQGLKTKNQGNQILQQLIKELDNQPDIEQFDFSREFHELENLGLCSFYYFKRSADPVLYDFQKKDYFPIDGHRSEDVTRSGHHVQCGHLHQSHEKTEEPAAFMATKWKLFGRQFTFVNLTLSPESSPLDGVKNYPTETVIRRRKELDTIVESSQKVSMDDFIIYGGNFNCQIDKEKMLQNYLHHNHAASHEDEDGRGKLSKVEGIDINGRKLYSIDHESFDFLDMHEWVFATCKGRLIRKYDAELDTVKDSLHEPNIYFPPTGPYDFDDRKNEDRFLKSSAPAWKERVLSNKRFWDLMHKDSFTSSSVYYGLVGVKDNIGENKPVSLITTISF